MIDYLDIVFGNYEPLLRAITLNNKNIEDYAEQDKEIFHTMIYMHENYHWLQLNSSSIGHLISAIPAIYDRIASFAIEGPKIVNKDFRFKKPAIMNVNGYSEKEYRGLRNDLSAVEKFQEFILRTNKVETVYKNFNDYNQACFSYFDLYLTQSYEILISKFDENTYLRMVDGNRKFWDDSRNYEFLNISKDLPIIGFKDLIECSARIIEIKHYRHYVEVYDRLEKTISLDTSYFWDEDYFVPFKYIKYLFNENVNEDYILDFLLLAIHISINPSVVPFYTLALDASNSISNIHPGMRFVKILTYIKKKYNCIRISMNNKDLHKQILIDNRWYDDLEQFKDYRIYYNDNYLKVQKEMNNGKQEKKLFRNDFFHYKHYTMLELKSLYTNFFINISKFMNNPEKVDETIKIHNDIYCPMIFNDEIDKYQMNVSGLIFETYMADNGSSEKTNIKRERTKNMENEFINYLMEPFFYDLDKQIINEKGPLDISILDYFDISEEMKNQLFSQYIDQRGLENINYI